jgi:coproporphyrinogen III oxidase-like Fe-S oxidoreductase
MISNFLRNNISRYFTGQKDIIFENNVPNEKLLLNNFSAFDEMGLYLHIPFCDRICPYCPYNKIIFNEEIAQEYVSAIKKEVNTYTSLLGNKPITSFYIGGGTPTTMLKKGIGEIINYVYKNFNMNCDVHMESHPNHLTSENLSIIEDLGVKYLSAGVEALEDKHLKILERPYTVNEVKKSIEKAVSRNFRCVNIDYIFDLPGQTGLELEKAAEEMVKLGVDQIAAYPLFHFSYTRFGKEHHKKRTAVATMFRRRKFLKILENIFYSSGYDRSSVWAFTKKGIEKYCSVTVPSYIGLGASGSTYLKDVFYVNTFNVSEYINAINKNQIAVALSINLTEQMQMAGWLYWRIYETKFRKTDFNKRFNKTFDEKYGKQMKILNKMEYLYNDENQIRLTDKGTYWIHAFEDYFSINYINKLWGNSKSNPWPIDIQL